MAFKIICLSQWLQGGWWLQLSKQLDEQKHSLMNITLLLTIVSLSHFILITLVITSVGWQQLLPDVVLLQYLRVNFLIDLHLSMVIYWGVFSLRVWRCRAGCGLSSTFMCYTNYKHESESSWFVCMKCTYKYFYFYVCDVCDVMMKCYYTWICQRFLVT